MELTSRETKWRRGEDREPRRSDGKSESTERSAWSRRKWRVTPTVEIDRGWGRKE
jgi:hypothetical protein